MAAFGAHPAPWAILASHPELGEQAAGEVIRWSLSATAVFRYAAEVFVYHDLPITRLTRVRICVPTA